MVAIAYTEVTLKDPAVLERLKVLKKHIIDTFEN